MIIRAFKAEKVAEDHFDKLLDKNSRVYWNFLGVKLKLLLIYHRYQDGLVLDLIYNVQHY